jgi:hypothetical protein
MAVLHNRRPRILFVIVVVVGNIIFWLIPDNVLELVAREQHVLCGRYSRTHFAWIVIVALLSAVAIFIRTAAMPKAIRRRLFALLTVLIVLVPVVVVADIALRLRTEYPYQPDIIVYHRPPNKTYRLTYEDKPEAVRSYPLTPTGFGRVDCLLSYDSNGYRNAKVPETCDIITVGDSFTEGSRVSDDQAWPAVLARLSGQAVYNVGISGYSPPEYLAAVKHYGLPLKPRLVLCMLYEGNDFRSSEVSVKTGVSFRQIIKSSPLLLGLNDLIIRVFGPINADADFPGQDVLSWLPVAYPHGTNARYYAFAPKQLVELNVSWDEFASTEPWFAAKSLLRELGDACKAAGAELILVYAPNKAHVVIPLAAPSLPAEKVRTFVALRSKKELPPADTFMKQIVENLENREAVIAQWCAERSIRFISPTSVLRDYAKVGKQPYYTYDQHWTPLGHKIVADTISQYLADDPAPTPTFSPGTCAEGRL